MRLFFAVPFPPEVRSRLAEVQAQLRAQGVRGSFTRPENLHLTLAFLGDTPRCRDAARVLAGLEGRSFPLTLSGLGAFGDVWWAGVAPSAPLEALAQCLQQRLRETGFPLERRPFRPHITLLRRARGQLELQPDFDPISVTASRVVLLESLRSQGRLLYRPVQEKRLPDGPGCPGA